MRRLGVATTAMLAVLGLAAAARGDFGDPLPGVSQAELDAFTAGRTEFNTTETAPEGLGPIFNDSSCSACHLSASGVIGGNTKRTETRFGTITNGVFDPLTALGGSLLQSQSVGPAGVLNTPQCATLFPVEVVPPQATIVAQRRTTPLFGLGLVDATPDATFTALQASEARDTPATAGIISQAGGVESGQKNVFGRFGWKAQNATLHIFAGDAYVNEMGITNAPVPPGTGPFSNENCPNSASCSFTQLGCLLAPEPNDNGTDVTAFTNFMTFLGPPPRGPLAPSDKEGEKVFSKIGCADCHTPTLTTGPNASAALNNVEFHPYSDFLLHDMGSLGDGITQGTATGTLMRTAPLWGLRTQLTLLHDGRATTVTDAINAHAGQGAAARAAFNALNATQRGKLLGFLGSL
jgi:CxxC motif-containing protein (DUF1111 family)